MRHTKLQDNLEQAIRLVPAIIAHLKPGDRIYKREIIQALDRQHGLYFASAAAADLNRLIVANGLLVEYSPFQLARALPVSKAQEPTPLPLEDAPAAPLQAPAPPTGPLSQAEVVVYLNLAGRMAQMAMEQAMVVAKGA